jgi:DNA-binding transcriptional LysR family regulator
MNSDDLSLFARIVKARSISRTAMEMGLDQSTISRRIGLLETELGVRLLHRSGRGVVPTDRGKQLLDYAAAVTGMLDKARQSMQENAEHGPVQLNIAAQPTIAKMLFGQLGHTLQQRYPKTRLHFVEAYANQILEKLADGELDLAVLYVPEQPGSLQFDVLLSEGVRLITPPSFPLPGDAISFGELARVPLILPSTHHGLRLLVESLAIRQGFSANIALECDGSTALITSLVMDNCGCTLLPEAAVIGEVAADRVKSYRVVDPEVRRRVGLVLGKNRVSPIGLWDTAQLIKAQVIALVQSGAWPDAVLDDALVGPAQNESSNF